MTEHFNEIRDGDDNLVSLAVFQAERAAAQLRSIADGTADRGDAELVARFLYALAISARSDVKFADNPAVDPHHTWEALAFLPVPRPRQDPSFTSDTALYVVTGHPSFRSHDAHVLLCTSINAATWPPTTTTGLHIAITTRSATRHCTRAPSSFPAGQSPPRSLFTTRTTRTSIEPALSSRSCTTPPSRYKQSARAVSYTRGGLIESQESRS